MASFEMNRKQKPERALSHNQMLISNSILLGWVSLQETACIPVFLEAYHYYIYPVFYIRIDGPLFDFLSLKGVQVNTSGALQ